MRSFGFWALLLKLGTKFGTKLVPLLLKVLKGGKAAKLGFAGASFGLWNLFFSWQFIVVLMGTIMIHECAHLWAMRRLGMKTKGFYFIPLMGAAAIPDDEWPSRGAEMFIAIAGPVVGALTALPFILVWEFTGNPLWAGIASWIAMVNLFNLIPVLPLDGGRILRSISFSVHRNVGIAAVIGGLALGAFLSWKLGLGLLLFMIVIGGFEVIFEMRHGKRVMALEAKYQELKIKFPWVTRELVFDGGRGDIESKLINIFESFTEKDLDKIIQLLESFPIEKNSMARINSARELYLPSYDKSISADERARKLKYYQSYLAEEFALLIIHERLMSNIPKHRDGFWKPFLFPMNWQDLAFASLSYFSLAALLLAAMYKLRHIPGATEALQFFAD